MAIVIALAFGRSRDPANDLPFNRFLGERIRDLEKNNNIIFTDLGNPKPPLITIDKAVARSKKTGERNFIVLVAHNGYNNRVRRDLINSLERSNIYLNHYEIVFDQATKNYTGFYYSPVSKDSWTKSWFAWTRYNFKETYKSFFYPDKYRQESYNQA